MNTIQLERALQGLALYDGVRWAEDLFDHRDYYAAARVLQHLVDTHPDDVTVSVRELLARSYYHSAQLRRAASTARDLLADRPDDAYAALLLARSLQRASDPAAAGALRYARALGADPEAVAA